MKIQPPTINIFEKVARNAGKGLIRDFGEIENLQIKSKNIGDFVTSADINVEKKLIESLSFYYPNYSLLSEEKGLIQKSDKETIIIDPIDGTTNFIHGIPRFAIVIAKKINQEITDGIIYNPVTNEFYWASKGNGAWCNNFRLRVSKRENLTDCIIGTGIPNIGDIYEGYLNEIDLISKNCSGLRRMGAAALDLAYVAAGKFDGFWEKNLNIWDIAAGVLILKEAGGEVTDCFGNPWSPSTTDLIASNTLIHDQLLNNLNM